MPKSDADRRRAALRRFMDVKGLKMSPWATAAKISEGAIRNFLAGGSDSMSIRVYEALARAAGARVADLTGENSLDRHIESADIADAIGANAPVPAGENMVTIRELDVRAAQGPGGFALEVIQENPRLYT